MASGDTLLQIPPQDLIPENSGNPSGGEFGLTTVGLGKGVGFNPLTDAGAIAVKRIPATYGATTGFTLKILVSDDPLNPCPGLVARFGVSYGLLGSNAAIAAATVGTEAAANVTLPATSGQTTELSIANVKANFASVVAGSPVLIRLRRIGTNAADTSRGRVIVHSVTLIET